MTSRLPRDVKVELGPDATALGWVFQYVLRDSSGTHSLKELRSYQDWYLKYYLKAVPGVSEVASLGGFTKQYQVNVDPNRLRSYGIRGICTSFLLELLVYPSIYAVWRGWQISPANEISFRTDLEVPDPQTGETILRIP